MCVKLVQGVEKLVEKVQNSSKITWDFHFSTFWGGGKVEKTYQYYANVENAVCRK